MKARIDEMRIGDNVRFAGELFKVYKIYLDDDMIEVTARKYAPSWGEDDPIIFLRLSRSHRVDINPL